MLSTPRHRQNTKHQTLKTVAALLVCALVSSCTTPPEFNEARAFADLERQVEFGARVPGSEPHAEALSFFVETLEPLAERVIEQPVTWTSPLDSSIVFEGVNVIASFNLSNTSERIMLAAHWDSRQVADQDPDSTKRTLPVPGANDGASGVAVLLEMARLFADQPPEAGIDIVFFDLEDQGNLPGDSAMASIPYALGSEIFVRDTPNYRPSYGILLDMVGDANLRIPREANSERYAKAVLDRVFEAAEAVGADVFKDELGQAIVDDHLPFLRKGIPVVDLIHTPFVPYWHTTEDTPDKCSPESLGQVGEVLIELLY